MGLLFGKNHALLLYMFLYIKYIIPYASGTIGYVLYYYIPTWNEWWEKKKDAHTHTHTHTHHGAKVGVFPFGIRRRFMARLMFYICLLYILLDNESRRRRFWIGREAVGNRFYSSIEVSSSSHIYTLYCTHIMYNTICVPRSVHERPQRIVRILYTLFRRLSMCVRVVCGLYWGLLLLLMAMLHHPHRGPETTRKLWY